MGKHDDSDPRGSRGRGGQRGGRGDGDGNRERRRMPGAARQPVGIEGARRTEGAPPRRRQVASAPTRPDLPDDVEIDLPRAVTRELRRSARDSQAADEAARCLTIASSLLEEREGSAALAYLAWAKHLAPRAPSIREALGVAAYLAEDYATALTELQAYRRFTNRADQNHLVADSLRALDRNTDDIPGLIEQMRAEEIDEERIVEGTIVWASLLADRGDVGAGRAVLRDALRAHEPGASPDEHHLRLWYVAGDLATRAGDNADARRWFERIDAAANEFFDVEERLAAL